MSARRKAFTAPLISRDQQYIAFGFLGHSWLPDLKLCGGGVGYADPLTRKALSDRYYAEGHCQLPYSASELMEQIEAFA